MVVKTFHSSFAVENAMGIIGNNEAEQANYDQINVTVYPVGRTWLRTIYPINVNNNLVVYDINITVSVFSVG